MNNHTQNNDNDDDKTMHQQSNRVRRKEALVNSTAYQLVDKHPLYKLKPAFLNLKSHSSYIQQRLQNNKEIPTIYYG